MKKHSEQISKSTSKRTLKALLWRVSDKGAQYGIQIVLQVVLARLLSPSDYGVYAVLAAIVMLLGVIIEGGLPSALIQSRDASEDDYSTVFWSNIALSIVIVLSLFLLAPYISDFFGMKSLCRPLQVASISLLFLGYNSLLAARYMKKLDFRSIFLRTVIALLLSGIVGVIVALMGFGIWALVWQQLVYQFVVFVYFAVRSRWHPSRVFNAGRLISLFSFGWKICVSSLLRSGYDSFLDLMLGKCMDNNSLGFYNRGRKFAQVASSVIDDPVKTVLFPAFSAKQNDDYLMTLRRIVSVYAFVSLPVLLLAIFFGEDIIVLLLSDSWRGSSFYFQICCFSYITVAISTPSLALFNSIGKSDVPMVIEAIRLSLTILFLVVAVILGFDNVTLISVVTFVSIVTSMLIIIPNNKLLGYSYSMQFSDYGKSFICAGVSFASLVVLNSMMSCHSDLLVCLAAALGYLFLYLLFARIMGIRGIKLINPYLQ